MQAIHGFRETEKSRWSDASQAILHRVQEAAFGPDESLLSLVHVLDLEPRGYIKPHVDSVKVGRRQFLRTPRIWVGKRADLSLAPPPLPVLWIHHCWPLPAVPKCYEVGTHPGT